MGHTLVAERHSHSSMHAAWKAWPHVREKRLRRCVASSGSRQMTQSSRPSARARDAPLTSSSSFSSGASTSAFHAQTMRACRE